LLDITFAVYSLRHFTAWKFEFFLKDHDALTIFQ